MVFAFAHTALAAPGFFSSANPPAPDSSAAQAASELFKLAPGCNLNIAVSDHYTTIINVGTGQYAVLSFFDDGRVAGLETAKGKGIIIYDDTTHRPSVAVDVTTGRSVKLDTAKGRDLYRYLRSQAKLPTPEKIVAQLCGQQKGYFQITDSLDSLLSADYWNDIEASYYGDFMSYYIDDPLKDCIGNLIACLEECDNIADVALFDCGVDAFVTGVALGPEIGAAIGALCTASALSNKWECQDRLRR